MTHVTEVTGLLVLMPQEIDPVGPTAPVTGPEVETVRVTTNPVGEQVPETNLAARVRATNPVGGQVPEISPVAVTRRARQLRAVVRAETKPAVDAAPPVVPAKVLLTAVGDTQPNPPAVEAGRAWAAVARAADPEAGAVAAVMAGDPEAAGAVVAVAAAEDKTLKSEETK